MPGLFQDSARSHPRLPHEGRNVRTCRKLQALTRLPCPVAITNRFGEMRSGRHLLIVHMTVAGVATERSCPIRIRIRIRSAFLKDGCRQTGSDRSLRGGIRRLSCIQVRLLS